MWGKCISVAFALLSVSAYSQSGTYNQNAESGRDSVKSHLNSNESRSSKSAGKTISVNALILQAYIDMFESGEDAHCPTNHDNAAYKAALTSILKVLSNPSYSFPVSLNTCFGNNPSTCDPRVSEVMPAFVAVDAISNYLSKLGRLGQPYVISEYPSTPMISMNDEATKNYIDNVLFAHAITTDVAMRLSGNVYASIADVKSEIYYAICSADMYRLDKAVNEIERGATCMGRRYSQYTWEGGNWHWSGPMAMDCGSVKVDADNHRFLVYGRETLSQSSISGINVTVSVSEDINRSDVSEKSKSTFDKSSKTKSKQKVEAQ